MRLLHLTCSLLLALLMLSPAWAADSAPWYEIELILFKQGGGDPDTEQWPDDPGSPDWSNLVSLNPGITDDPSQPQPYSVLPTSAWQLRTLYDRLRRSSLAEPLFHQAWKQPVASSESAAQPIYLGPDFDRAAEGSPLPLFEGTIKISVNRYFHVNLDLLLTGANRTLPATASLLTASPTLGSVRFQASRRMRSGEVHYIDHPMIGALIQISRIEPPPPAEPEPQAAPPEATDSTPEDSSAESIPDTANEADNGSASPPTATTE